MTLRRAARTSVISAVLRLRNFRAEDAILLSCDPRSGSTWLSELLCALTPSAVIWEPFHLDSVPRVRDLGFAWRQYIPAEADWPEAEALVSDVLSGRVINGWTTSASPVVDFINAQRLIVKCCRANGFLPWMVRRFEFRRRPIHFLRHPFAIAASQLQMGIFGTSGMDEDLDRGPYAQHLADSAKYIRNLRTDEEKIVAMWCRVHRIALQDEVTESRVVRLYYESLCLHPEREVARLFDAWNEPIPHVALKYIRKASRMTREGSLLATPAEQVARWQSYFSDAQISRMARILSDFEIGIYGEGPLPEERSNP